MPSASFVCLVVPLGPGFLGVFFPVLLDVFPPLAPPPGESLAIMACESRQKDASLGDSDEQARTALEHDATHVMMLVRRHGLVCPEVVDHINLVRPFTYEFDHDIDGSGIVINLWRQAYDSAAAQPPETWQRGVFRPDGHSVSVSDIYFVGHHGM